MPNIDVLDMQGKKVGSMELSEEIFASPINVPAMHLVVRSILANQRQGTQSALSRGMVRGGGRKIYRQKGTGNARHHGNRAPQFRHGGVVFAPQPRDYVIKVPKKVRRLAMKSALTSKYNEGSIIVVDEIKLQESKTKLMAQVLKALNCKGKLARYGCMDEAYWFNSKEFDAYFTGTDTSPLDERYYKVARGEPLPWEFFGDLAEKDGVLLKDMLAARAGGGRLNVLFYGAPGTGKTSFACALAKAVGGTAYELLQGERDGKNISTESRMAGIQIFNERIAGAHTMLIVDEADELLRTNAEVYGGGTGKYYDWSDLLFYRALLEENPIRTVPEKCFKYLHLEGAHQPHVYDKDLNVLPSSPYRDVIEGNLTMLRLFLQRMKEAGVYDNTAIVLLSDHGSSNGRDLNTMNQHTMLLIKGKNEHHPFRTDDAPVAYVDLQGVFRKLLDGESSETVFDWKAGDARERYFFDYELTNSDILTEYVQTGHAEDMESFRATGRVLEYKK